jgi:flavin reductase (DIM6/NTAB) family NADH-FMN oxidoreductase RutF
MYRECRGSQAMGYLATKPTMIVTTRHASGVVNAGVFGAYTNLSATQVGIAVAKGSHTYRNLLRDGEFTINVPGADLIGALATLADNLPESVSEIEAAGLTCRNGVVIGTPSIAECQAAAEFVFEREIPVGTHHFMIGKNVGGWIRESALDRDGRIDIFKARVFKDFKYPEPLYVLPGEIVRG